MTKKEAETKELYTIRLEASVVKKLQAIAKKRGVTHAEVARQALHKAVASMKAAE